MHHHWQNLNEKDGVKGSGLINGRAWLHWGYPRGDRNSAQCGNPRHPDGAWHPATPLSLSPLEQLRQWWRTRQQGCPCERANKRNSTIGVQWVWHRRLQLGLAFQIGSRGAEHDLAIRIHLAFFSLYLHTERVLPTRWLPDGYDDHEFRLELYSMEGDYTLAWAWNGNPMSWRSKDPWYRNGSKSLNDMILGRAVYSQGAPETHWIEVPMPEANYLGTCIMRTDSWKRPRWFRKQIRRADITMDQGAQVPFPGKGENSWDCGEDGIFGMTCPARDVPEAISKVVESALRSRAKNGGRNWKPTVEHLGI